MNDDIFGREIYAIVNKAFVKLTKDLVDASPSYELGRLPNKRGGFGHIHSGHTECGMAFHKGNWRVQGEWTWGKCSRLVNHGGECNDDEDHSAY